jgi:hypothetical protein
MPRPKKRARRRPERRVDLDELVAICEHCGTSPRENHGLGDSARICPTCGALDQWLYVTRPLLHLFR